MGWPIEIILYSHELFASDYGRRLVEQWRGRAEEVAPPILASLCGKDNPQGILAIAQRRRPSLGTLEPSSCGVALARPQDPGNLGTVLRTLEAAGGSALYVIGGGVDPFHPTAVRASMGACLVLPIVEAGPDEFHAWRRARGIQLIGSSAHAETDYRDTRPTSPWVLMLGNEQKGLSASEQEACDVVVRIPMLGRATSLNLAVAAGVLLFEYSRARSQ